MWVRLNKGEGDDIIQNKSHINECTCTVECWLLQHFEFHKIISPLDSTRSWRMWLWHMSIFVTKKKSTCQTKQYPHAFSKIFVYLMVMMWVHLTKISIVDWSFGHELIVCVIICSCLVNFWCMLGGYHCGGLNEELSLLVRQRPNSFWHCKGFHSGPWTITYNWF
jgi:hypothetical protein